MSETLPPAGGVPSSPPLSGPRPRPASRRKLFAAGGTALCAVAVAGVVVAGPRSSATGGYRTAAAEVQAVDQVLDRVATVEPVSQASVAFPVAGTVASVDVTAGDQVATGDVLATLGTTTPEATLVEKQAALAAAELTLERALNGEDVGGAGGSPSAGDAVTPAALSSDVVVQPASAVSAASTDEELAAAQQAVLDAQHQVGLDMATAQQALDDAATACAAVTDDAGTGDAAADAATGATPSTTTAADGDGVASCRDALDAVLAAQTTVAADQTALIDAADALDALLDERAAASTGSVGSGSGTGSDGSADAPNDQDVDGGSEAPSGAAPGAGDGSGDGTASGGQGGASAAASATSSPSSEELIAYQKAVDAAAADVAVAGQAVAQSTIVSPITGTVQAVDLAVGDSVTAGSATAAIVVVGDGGYEVTTTVTVDDLPTLAIGQPVQVEPDGADTSVAGEVVAIGVAGSSSGSTTTYPVTIGLTGDTEGLRNGATASVAITTDAADDALAVPTSAVTADGGRHTVTVLDGGSTEDVAVEIGVMGDVWTEIVSGVEEGQRVVLADLDEPLPSSATDGPASGSDGFGFPGGGRIPGG